MIIKCSRLLCTSINLLSIRINKIIEYKSTNGVENYKGNTNKLRITDSLTIRVRYEKLWTCSLGLQSVEENGKKI